MQKHLPLHDDKRMRELLEREREKERVLSGGGGVRSTSSATVATDCRHTQIIMMHFN